VANLLKFSKTKKKIEKISIPKKIEKISISEKI
jgi:hypothetical protein